MAEIDFYYPFDSIDGDRKTTAATERRFFGALFTDGVAGANGFPISTVAEGVYSIGAGVAIISGAIGGVINAKQVAARPAADETAYIVLRLDTTNAVRKVTLEVVSSIENATAAQLDNGGKRDLVLYSVTGQTGGGFGLLDQRKYCTSFDNEIYSQNFQALYDATKADGEAQMDALRVSIAAAIAEANAETAGMYGAAGRQGFINPNFAVNQRGESSYGTTGGEVYAYDRWKLKVEGRKTADPVAVYKLWDGVENRLSLQVLNRAYPSGTAAAASCVSQSIENGVFDFCNGGKRFTVSFDAKASAPQRVAVEPIQNAGGSAERIAAQVVEVTTEWQRFSLTFAGTIGVASNSGGNYLTIPFYFAWANNAARFGADQNAAGTINFANMQINEGSAALPCYEPPYAEQLHQCQRYYCKFGNVSLSAGATLATSNQVTTSPLPLPRHLYRKPSVTAKDRAGVAGVASAEIAAGGWRNGLAYTLSDQSADVPVFVVTNTDASAVTRVVFNSIALDAEIED
jgi:hypothetical protein